MAQALSLSTTRRHVSGWLGVASIALLYAALYAGNLWLPLTSSNYTTRIWNWSQMALTVAAVVVLLLKWHALKPGAFVLGLALAIVSALSHALHDPSLGASVLEGVGVWICLLGGIALFNDGAAPRIPAFQPPLAAIGRSLVVGMVVALPLAAVNNLYFYLSSGTMQFQNALYSALEALSPAIHEEIIFRFFVLALCLYLLRFSEARRWVMIVAIMLAVVPHSLNHLPDLFLANPLMGLVMLTATSLLFGLPMALLQIKRNLETAIAFHWFINFIRFLSGF